MDKIAERETSRGRGDCGATGNWYMALQRRGVLLAHGIRDMEIRTIGNYRGHHESPESRSRCQWPQEHVIA